MIETDGTPTANERIIPPSDIHDKYSRRHKEWGFEDSRFKGLYCSDIDGCWWCEYNYRPDRVLAFYDIKYLGDNVTGGERLIYTELKNANFAVYIVWITRKFERYFVSKSFDECEAVEYTDQQFPEWLLSLRNKRVVNNREVPGLSPADFPNNVFKKNGVGMLRRKTKPYGRCYVDDVNNAEYPSVTSILNVLEKHQLSPWKMKLMGEAIIEKINDALQGKRLLNLEEIIKEAKKAPDNYRDSKGDRGTFVHEVIEHTLNGEDVTEIRKKDPKISALMFQLNKWLTETKTEPVLIEAFLYSEKYGYAGTVDLVAHQTRNGHDKDLALIDFKTSKNLYDTNSWQLAAYCQAYAEMYGETPSIAYIMHLDYDRSIIAEAMHIHKEEIDTEIKKFLHIFEAFKARNAKHLKQEDK